MKKLSNRNFRQTRSERSATGSARAYGQIQRMGGWDNKFKVQNSPLRKNYAGQAKFKVLIRRKVI